jgi:hypothetical protein
MGVVHKGPIDELSALDGNQPNAGGYRLKRGQKLSSFKCALFFRPYGVPEFKHLARQLVLYEK